MRLNDLVQIDNRFEKAVNLLLDLNDAQKLNSYIPTRSSVNLLKGYFNEVTGFFGERANILIGPYGKGKSHLLLVLMAVLSGKPSEELNELIERVKSIDAETGDLMGKINSSYKFLPVIVNTNSGNLGQAFVRSLNMALKREGLVDIVPDNYFSEAVSTIRLWKEVYPDTYDRFNKNTGIPVDQFVHNLETYNYESLDEFRKIFPLITSGSEFNPIVDDEAISVYRSINRELCLRHGYSGIYVVFDEFSKYIEGHTEEGFSADMKLLQDICELCNSSHDEQMHMTCVAHKAVRAYGDSLSKGKLNAFRGVEGRLTEIPFIVSTQNNYELVADVIHKKDAFDKWKRNNIFIKLVEQSYSIPVFTSLFDIHDFDVIVGEGCFPLTPLGTFLLLNLSEKVAQNERTLFTFLTGKDIHGLAALVENSDDITYVGSSYIYDYFQPLFESDKNTLIHKEWLRADYALSKTEKFDEKSVIKSLAIIRMVNRVDDVPAKMEFLRLASGMSEATFKNALDSLIDKGIIAYKKKTAVYDFQNKIGVNIDNEVADCAIKYFSKIDVPAVLNDVRLRRYILPKKYNQNHFMTRYFRVIYMSPESFLALSSIDYLHDENEPDGFLIIVCANENIEKKILTTHLSSIDDKRIILGVIDSIRDLDDSTRSLLAVQKLINNKEFISENENILTELKSLEAELVDELNRWMMEVEQSLNCLYSDSVAVQVDHYGINRAVSDICEEVYNKTPHINHELINRHTVSAQISKARNSIMDDILHGRSMEKYNTGTSAESTIYRALIVHTKEDAKLSTIRNEIVGFIHESKGRRVPFSKLVSKLTCAPYGMRKGPLPVYILQQLTELEDMPVVYLGNKELPIDAPLMANIMKKPEDYSLYVEEETGQKLEYIESLEELFGEYTTYCREIDKRNRLSKLTCTIQSWYRSLPQTATTFREKDYDGQNLKRIDSFRNLFNGNVNPREVLFDKLPKIFGCTDLEATYESVKFVKKELDNHIHLLKEKAVNEIRYALGLEYNSDLFLSIQEWYTSLSDNVKNSVFTNDSQRLIGVLRNLKRTSKEDIAEKVSKEITGFFIEDWNDKTLQQFKDGILELTREIGEKENRADDKTGQRITLSTREGMREYLYDFNPNEMTASGVFFQNALEDMMEEYGESLENSEKIGILMQMVKKLMG